MLFSWCFVLRVRFCIRGFWVWSLEVGVCVVSLQASLLLCWWLGGLVWLRGGFVISNFVSGLVRD